MENLYYIIPYFLNRSYPQVEAILFSKRKNHQKPRKYSTQNANDNKVDLNERYYYHSERCMLEILLKM